MGVFLWARCPCRVIFTSLGHDNNPMVECSVLAMSTFGNTVYCVRVAISLKQMLTACFVIECRGDSSLDLIRTSIHNQCSGTMKTTAQMDHISH